MFRLVISPQAQKQLKAIKQSHNLAVKLALIDIKENPNLGKSLARELAGKFSYRVGIYRIIYKVNENDKVIYILTAGHRSNIYKEKLAK